MRDWLRQELARRPWWMNALLLFCAFMTFVYLPYDFLWKSAAQDVEVWLGLRVTGLAAKLSEPLHWAIYAAGAWGFWRMRSWMWPWAAVYTAQVAVGMLVWNLVYDDGGGLLFGAVSAALFGWLAWALWRARDHFQGARASLRERYGEWALVTGASAGIGEAFARALAREGMSCVLSARREDRLRALADELEKTHHVATRVVAADLSDPEGADRLAGAVEDLDIAVLVNNAGFGYAGRFEKQDTGRLRELVNVNCVAPVVLTSRLLRGMRGRGRGAVVFSGSVAGAQPVPLHAAYAASKAFDQLLGESLWGELIGSGVDVLVLMPGPVATEFQDAAGEIPHPGAPAARVVETALDALGRQPSVIAGAGNYWRAQGAMRLLPRSVAALVARAVMAAQTPPAMR